MSNALSFDELIARASQAANNGDWNGTLAFLLEANKSLPGQVELISAIGGTLIQLGRVEEALPYYQQALMIDKKNPSAYLNLANTLSLLNQWEAAEQTYRKGIELDDENRFLWKGLARVCLNQGKSKEGVQILAALVTSDETDTEALLLLAECYEMGNDLESAEYLVQKVLNQENENELARQALKRINAKRGTGTTVNVQALAQKLKALKEKTNSAGGLNPDRPIPERNVSPRRTICFYGPAQTSVEVRFAPVIETLMQKGMKVKIATRYQMEAEVEMDGAVFARPHLAEEFTRGVEELAKQGVHVVVDLDEDFYQIPPAYYGYEEVGAANPQAMQRLGRILQAASVVSVPSAQLAEVYRPHTSKVVVIPYAWDDNNPMWKKQPPRRTNPQIGIIANHTQAIDIALVNESIGRILEQFPSLLVGIIGNLKTYEALTAVSDERKYFIPPGKLEDYPFLLADFDVLLFPLADFPYNQSRSDLALVEAGARGVAWVATPIPSYLEWKDGGMFASQPADWESALELLLQSAETRQKLARMGEQKAESRRINALIDRWMEIL